MTRTIGNSPLCIILLNSVFYVYVITGHGNARMFSVRKRDGVLFARISLYFTHVDGYIVRTSIPTAVLH